ncbi:MAG: ATP-binding protein [Anaerolineales bacterium]
MRINWYHYSDTSEPGWEFDPVSLGKMNLLVGETASGKSRFLNTMFHLGRYAVVNDFYAGNWEIKFEHNGKEYSWELRSRAIKSAQKKGIVEFEKLTRRDGEKEIELIKRSEKEIVYCGKTLDPLPKGETSLYLLRETEDIGLAYKAFELILRRLFDQDALSSISEFQPISIGLQSEILEKHDLEIIRRAELNLNNNLFFLEKVFPDLYKQIIEDYKLVFPFVEEVGITDLSKINEYIAFPGIIPVFTIREHGSTNWIILPELSSGMKKVLLIMTDITMLPEGGVYLIDEYENSLGLNAINFFPEFVLSLKKGVQFVVTSHHPYLINQIPPSEWYVLHREGLHVQIQYGQTNVNKYGKSKQELFTQLINDPFFRGMSK